MLESLINTAGVTMRFLSILLFFTLIISCSTERPSGKTEAEVLFKEAQELMKDDRYLLATERLNTLRQQYPYSYFATHAELMQADILYAQENFVEAAAAYILFKDFHPRHKKLPYVIWRIAESHYYQLPDTFDRDLSPGYEAIKYYKELKRAFAKYEKANNAQDKINEINKMIEQKEQYIADFYFKTKVYDAARFRYLEILRNFNNKVLRDYSMIRVIKSAANLEQPKSCRKHYKVFKTRISNKSKSELDEAYKRCMGNKGSKS
jgi:outer membrane protein assembly factor BamD